LTDIYLLLSGYLNYIEIIIACPQILPDHALPHSAEKLNYNLTQYAIISVYLFKNLGNITSFMKRRGVAKNAPCFAIRRFRKTSLAFVQ
jgi:hypothetical protein